MKIDNQMTRVKVNNEIDLCEVANEKVRRKLEAALQYARVSYFLRWQEPGFFKKVFMHERTRLIFCVNAAQLENALAVCDELMLTEKEIRYLGEKSKNRYVYEK